jgi:hypothetical protein
VKGAYPPRVRDGHGAFDDGENVEDIFMADRGDGLDLADKALAGGGAAGLPHSC